MSLKLFIRKLQVGDSIEELTKLLNKSYKQLADQGMRYLASHQDTTITKSRISNGTCFVAVLDEMLIGTVTVYLPGQHHEEQFGELINSAKFGQFGVLPEYQKQGIGLQMMEHIEQFVTDNNVFILALDTAETALHLIKWYEKLGYKFVRYADWKETNYRSVIMAKKLK